MGRLAPFRPCQTVSRSCSRSRTIIWNGIVLLVLLLSACTAEKTESSKQERVVLHVQAAMTLEQEQEFFRQYVLPYELLHQDIWIEFENTLKGEPNQSPDIMLVDLLTYKTMSQAGELANMEVLMQQDSFDLSQASRAASVAGDILRYYGNGVLFGATNEVLPYVLYYNEDLFMQAGVPLPRHRMTWDEAFELAGRFPEGLIGLNILNFPRPIEFILNVTDLDLIDAATHSVKINTPEWNNWWSRLLPVIRDGHVALGSQGEEYEFSRGKIAMIYRQLDLRYAQMLSDDSKGALPNFKWGWVTAPIDPQSNVGNYGLRNIMVIPATSEHKREAWAFVRYQLEQSEQLLQKRVKDMGLDVYDELFTLSPLAKERVVPTRAVEFMNLVNGQAYEVMEGRKTVEEALEFAHVEGQKLLDKD